MIFCVECIHNGSCLCLAGTRQQALDLLNTERLNKSSRPGHWLVTIWKNGSQLKSLVVFDKIYDKREDPANWDKLLNEIGKL